MNMDNTQYNLETLAGLVRTQLRTLEWAMGPGRQEIDALVALVPNARLEFFGELIISGHVESHHWDNMAPMFHRLEMLCGSLALEIDDPQLRCRTYKASGHPFLSVRIRVSIPVESNRVITSCRAPTTPTWEYYWIEDNEQQ